MTIEHSEAERCTGIVISAKPAVLRDENGEKVLNARGRPVYQQEKTFGFILLILPKAGSKKVFYHIRHMVGGVMPVVGDKVSFTLILEPNPTKCDSAIEVVILSEPARVPYAQPEAASSRQW